MPGFYDNNQRATCERYHAAEQAERAKIVDLQSQTIPRLKEELGTLEGELSVATNALDQIVRGIEDAGYAGAACATSVLSRRPTDMTRDCVALAISLTNQRARQQQIVQEIERQIRNRTSEIRFHENDLAKWKRRLADTEEYIRNKC